MKTKFDEQLEEMHVELIKMGSLCEQAITLSSRALLGDEKSQVEQVYSVDGEIDQQEREIENICMRLLLLQRPFASDLRKISAALKMISDMERIGDQASDIADMVPYIRFSEAKSKVHIEAMAKATVKMVTDSVDAFVQDDLDLEDNKLPGTTKKESGHGMGFANVQEVLRKYGAEYTVSCRDRWFRFTCAIPVCNS